MRIVSRCIPDWPKLAWVAVFRDGDDVIVVHHGPMVEVCPQWCAEAVWVGDFEKGDFDQTDLVFGSGVRCRDNKVTFVSPATAMEGLYHCKDDRQRYFANSLAALLAVAGLSLRDDYDDYLRDETSIGRFGILDYVRVIPTQTVDAYRAFFSNLVYDGHDLVEIDRPETAPHFERYEDYYSYLVDIARAVGENMRSPARRYAIGSLVGISSGYDSPAAAVISKYAGCTEAVTVKQSSSVWRGSDSGVEIARYLGMSCTEYDHRARDYRDEVTIWSDTGSAGGLNLTLFDYPKPLCLFWSGIFGDKVWDRAPHDHDLTSPRRSANMAVGEFRLHEGIFHTSVPWWGIVRAHEIHAIGLTPEMEPWSVSGSYDRPIARRIVEEAGVPRSAFGRIKKNTSSNVTFLWPFSKECQDSLKRYANSRGVWAPFSSLAFIMRKFAGLGNFLRQNILGCIGVTVPTDFMRSIAAQSLIYPWANWELKQLYETGLRSAEVLRKVEPGANRNTS